VALIDFFTGVLIGNAVRSRMDTNDVRWRGSTLAQAHPDQAESALTEADAQIRAIEAQRAAVVRGVATFALVFVLTIVALVVAGLLASARGQTLTCEASGAYLHCFDHHGYLSTEERRGDYVHGHDNRGRAMDA
jgi:hypothetical protein